MKTLITTLAVFFIAASALPAKDGTFVSAIITDKDQPVHLILRAREWIKITNFVQNNATTNTLPGVAVFHEGTGMWILFATDPTGTNEPVIIAGPATVNVSIPSNDVKAFLTYQRGSD